MIETRMDDRVAYGFQATPGYDTRVVMLDNGQEKRNVNRTKARRRYSAVYQNFTPTLFAVLLATFHAVRGMAYAFRFKDWTDFEATNEPLGNTPGANQTPVQLKKTYTFGSQSVERTITKPNSSGFTLYQADGSGGWVAKAGTLDTATGLFTPTTNWTAGRALRWTGTFDVAVRFASDEMPAAYDNLNAITTNVELVEVLGE